MTATARKNMKKLASGSRKKKAKKKTRKKKRPAKKEPVSIEDPDVVFDFDTVIRGILAVPSMSTDPRKKKRPG